MTQVCLLSPLTLSVGNVVSILNDVGMLFVSGVFKHASRKQLTLRCKYEMIELSRLGRGLDLLAKGKEEREKRDGCSRVLEKTAKKNKEPLAESSEVLFPYDHYSRH